MNKNKKWKNLILIVVAFVAIIAIVVLISTLGGHRFIKIKSTIGTVSLERDSSDKQIIKDMNLKSKDRVTTGNDGLVELLVDEDKHILARENTCFNIVSKGNDNKGKLKIKLEYGTSLIGIDNKLKDGQEVELETPNANLSVRGTTFEVTYNDDMDKTTVSVSEGVVRVSTDREAKDVEAGQRASIIKDGDIVIEDNYPYNDVVAFEALTYAGEPGGVFVKELVDWKIVTGNRVENINDNNHEISFSICSETEFMEGIERLTEEGRAKTDIEYINNLDGDQVTCVHYYQESVDGSRRIIEYSYFKKIDDEKGIAIDVSCAESLYYNFDIYLPLTMDCYYVIGGNDPEDVVTEEPENEVVEGLDDITYISSGDEIIFYLKDRDTWNDTGIGVKEIVSWEYMPGNHPELITKKTTSRVNLRYEHLSEESYNLYLLRYEHYGYALSSLENDDGEVIVYFENTEVANDILSQKYIYFKPLPGNKYICIEAWYFPSEDEKAQVDAHTYLPLTNNEYFEFPENFFPEDVVGTEIAKDQISTIFGEDIDAEQLEYLLDVAETCRFEGNENYIKTGLDILWYMYYTDIVIPVEGSSFTYYTYDLNYLNNMFSILTDETIGANNIPDVATIDGEKLVFKPCDITMGGRVTTTIVKITETENGQLIVEYNFRKTYGSDGSSGIQGTSRAYFKKDDNGKYRFFHIVEITSEEYSF